MSKVIPVVNLIYKSKDNNWRGFCYPYDVSVTASSQVEVTNKLKDLVQLYEESLARHGNPSHLIEKELTNEEDQKTLNVAWPTIREAMAKQLQKITKPKGYLFAGQVTFDNDLEGIALYSSRGIPAMV